MPDDAGVALLRTNYVQPHRQIHAGYGIGGGPGECSASGRVSIWRLDQSTLIPIFSSLLCEEIETQAVVDDMAIVSHVYGWEFSDRIHNYVPVEFVWNAVNQAYELTSTSETALVPLPSERSVPPPYQQYRGENLFLQHEYERIIDYQQKAITEIPDISDPVLLRWRYLAALTLEVLDRPAEALAEYIAIYEAAPDSVWGTLASLHVE